MSDYRTTNVIALQQINQRYWNGELSLDELKEQVFGNVHERTAAIAQRVLEDPNTRVPSPAPYRHTGVYGEEARDATPY